MEKEVISVAGDPRNAAVWPFADVYIGRPEATVPTGGATLEDNPEWDAVGLLNGDDGFTESMSADSNDHFGWGGILVATTRGNFKLTRQFTTYEDNQTVLSLWYPGSEFTFDEDGGYEGDVVVPDLAYRFKVGFELRQGNTVKRQISRNYAQIEERGDSSEGESELASRQFTVAIYPDAQQRLFYTYKGPVGGGADAQAMSGLPIDEFEDA